MTIDAGDKGAIVKTDTGTINITSTGDELDQPINISIGTVEYVGDDGTKIAYQAGGIFRETGNETQVVSAPPIYYDKGSGINDETFTFPVIEVSDDTQISSGEIAISQTIPPDRRDVPPLKNSTIKVNVTSKYCVGWENYFRQETKEGGDAIQESCNEGKERRVVAELGRISREYLFESGGAIIAPNGYEDDFCTGGPGNSNCQIESKTVDNPPVLDKYIKDIIKKASNSSEYETPSESQYDELDDGKYYIEGIDSSDEFEFDLSGGNATLVVAGEMDLGEIEVSGDNDLKIYTNASKITIGGDVHHGSKDGSGAQHIQTFGTSNTTIDGSPNKGGYYEGLIYAMSRENKKWGNDIQQGNPDEKCQAFVQANGVTIDGAVVAYGVCAQSNGMGGIKDNDAFQDELIDLLPRGYKLSPDVYYLNIAEYKVQIERQ
ncbi:hypothetical protein [Natrinema hispanicum]|nr:hypothetical protein [Natrinema hispanicum]